MPAGIHRSQLSHQRIEALHVAIARYVMFQPLSECCVEGATLPLRNGTSLFDQIFIRAQCDVLHTKIVYTIFVSYRHPACLASPAADANIK